MLAKVIDDKHISYDTVFRVSYINNNRIAGRIDGDIEIITANFEEVELSSEEEWEDAIIEHKEVLMIKKPAEASFYIYHVIVESISMYLQEPLRSIQVINEEESKTKKAWIKRLRAMANGKRIYMIISSRKYSNNFEVTISEIDKDTCMEICNHELKKLESDLKEKKKRINGLKQIIQFTKKENKHKNSKMKNTGRA